MARQRERWGTRVGAILAVTGSAVGLGNFIRFPGQAAQYGGGAFMIPYIIAFLIVGLPLAWAEWALGRYGGAMGHNSVPGIFRSLTKRRSGAYIGLLGTLMPVMIYMYYVFVEAWCLAYAWDFMVGNFTELGSSAEKIGAHFKASVGATKDGAVFSGGASRMLLFVGICFVVNFIMIYRGVSKGIEKFCNIAMPLLVVCAIVVLVRVLTLGAPVPDKPDQNLTNGLGYMWNPVQEAEDLAPGDKHLAAAIRNAALMDEAGPVFAAKFDVEKITKLLPLKEPESKEDSSPNALLSRVLDEENKPKDPHSVAGPDLQEGTKNAFDSLVLKKPETFRLGLAASGWTRDDSDGSERWSHSGTRLVLEVQGKQAKTHAPGFWAVLSNPEVWLAATGQIFFSLSVGFGLILTYASYLKRNDDVALSSLTAAAGNGFCEVVLGGMIVIPAAFMFLGQSGVSNPPGTFSMGFVALPNVFNQMPAGWFFGFLFFFLLFLAAVTSSLSMLQPSIALLEEGLGIGRKASVTMLSFITLTGAAFVVYFSKDLLALDTIDFWMANFFIFIMATVQVILFSWIVGIDKGMTELRRGAEIRMPNFLKIVLKYISPLYLIGVFGLWCYYKMPERIEAILKPAEGEPPVILMSLGLIFVVAAFFALIVNLANKRWDKQEASK
jgi:SNF family Na+-dependent transporter